MNTERQVDPCRRAELEINRILARLESETGRLVTDVALRHADVTRIDCAGRELLSGAVITLQQMPEHRRWEGLP